MRMSAAGFSGMTAVALAFTLPCSPCLGIIIRDDRLDSSYLALAADANYDPVGAWVNGSGYSGSGTLIAPDWVLTAAHNLITSSSGTFTINGAAYASTEVILHPSYQSANQFAGNDIGLVHLSTPVTGVTPAVLYNGSDELNRMAVFVGFGLKGTGSTGYQSLDNLKRACENVIDGNFGNPSILLASDFDNPNSAADNGFGSPTPTDLEGCVAPGDSGGGVFITIGSQTYLAGVIAFVAAADGSANSDYGDASGFGRVSAFDPWIFSKIPEPSITCFWAVLGGFCVILHRMRRAH